MSMDSTTLDCVVRIVAAVAERTADDIRPEQRLFEDLGLDSLQITEITQKLENALGRPIDDDLLNADGATVARCAEIAAAA
ncbi:acyl carrier protein [Streptomyces qinzhouensis]|uniref:Acyl carrier protein n=1 Tax=Streptomyces qinzhouensis TaxID=2599401 RepID=A0A5B8IP78_9ACTN|nr:acyl carrier protein [Streptomyces qinzhouensis]QDY80392.1 acyl carrier protein [Streptomyces qinzhouensis]